MRQAAGVERPPSGKWYRHPNWEEAFRILRETCPESVGFRPDDIPCLSAATVVDLPTSGRSDLEIAGELWSKLQLPSTGGFVVVTDASFIDSVGPFFVQATSLAQLIEGHADRIGDAFFAGDVVMVHKEVEAIFVVHHSEVAMSWRAR